MEPGKYALSLRITGEFTSPSLYDVVFLGSDLFQVAVLGDLVELGNQERIWKYFNTKVRTFRNNPVFLKHRDCVKIKRMQDAGIELVTETNAGAAVLLIFGLYWAEQMAEVNKIKMVVKLDAVDKDLLRLIIETKEGFKERPPEMYYPYFTEMLDKAGYRSILQGETGVTLYKNLETILQRFVLTFPKKDDPTRQPTQEAAQFHG